jgi:predicted molibdopterin-dependent oxidoreductase YjgC
MIKTLFLQKLGTDQIGLLDPGLPRPAVPYGSLDQIAAADLLLVVGANPLEDQPVASFLIKRAVDQGTRLIAVDGAHNPLIPFAHMSFEMADLEQATQVAARAESPLVLYGTGAAEADLAKLQGLEKATFVGLEPGGNARGAATQGLNGSAAAGGIEVVYAVLGEQPWTEAEAENVAEDAFLIVQASFESPLTARADVVLPAAIWSERSGTLTNLEGRLCEAKQAIEPAGAAKADWEILSLLADKLGHGPAASLEELSALAAQGLN